MFASGQHIVPWDAGFKVSHTHVAMVQSPMPTRKQANHDCSSRIILRDGAWDSLQDPSGTLVGLSNVARTGEEKLWVGRKITVALRGKFQTKYGEKSATGDKTA